MRRFVRGLVRLLLVLGCVLLLLPPLAVFLYREVNPSGTPLMALRWLQGEDNFGHEWVGFEEIAPVLRYAVIAAEDNRFCTHRGFDWQAIEAAIREYKTEGRLRGASTISMQTARNLLLWTGGGVPRKLAEVYVTLLIESLWDKRRILEVYLNIIEWGHGIYGAEAAAQSHFGRPATALDIQSAALLAAVLPNPRRWSPAAPTDYIRERAARIRIGIRELGPLLDCAGPPV